MAQREDQGAGSGEVTEALDRMIEGTGSRAMVAKMRSDQRGFAQEKTLGRFQRDARRDLRPLGR